MPIEPWPLARLSDVAALWNRTCPSETLDVDELSTVLADAGGHILGADDGSACVAFVQGADAASDRGNIRLLVVAPEQQRRGLGLALVAAAEMALQSQGVQRVRLAAGVPRYLWPGIDIAWTPARSLAARAGYRVVDTAVNMALPTNLHVRVPRGIELHPLGPDEHAPLAALVDANWPMWSTEVNLALSHGRVFGAWSGHRMVGFIAHSAMRRGWISPMGTITEVSGQGVGSALLAVACEDLARSGVDVATIAWVGPQEFFARHGARVTRRFERWEKDLNRLTARRHAGPDNW